MLVDLFKKFLKVLEALENEGVDYILVGGFAVIIHGMPRLTQDIDILARLGEAATYDDLEYETITMEGISIKVATPETLFNLKKDTVRPEDKRDAFFLDELIRRQGEG